MPDTVQTLAFPVRVTGTTIAAVEQASIDDVTGQVHMLVLTPPGWFDSAPGFGLADQAHLPGGPDVGEIERQIAEHVPDAPAAVTERPDALNPALALVGVQIGA